MSATAAASVFGLGGIFVQWLAGTCRDGADWVNYSDFLVVLQLFLRFFNHAQPARGWATRCKNTINLNVFLCDCMYFFHHLHWWRMKQWLFGREILSSYVHKAEMKNAVQVHESSLRFYQLFTQLNGFLVVSGTLWKLSGKRFTAYDFMGTLW